MGEGTSRSSPKSKPMTVHWTGLTSEARREVCQDLPGAGQHTQYAVTASAS